ncbi:MAG: alanyl-tRNA editing protein [Candidatus Diapherotrites archaeon]|nr:alanyl-tRNA editing protein [Candidatus Diapherotrites archaeon]
MAVLTKELFLSDHYQKECQATITKLLSPTEVVLDQTVFYPQGGGQPFDTGVLEKDGESYTVTAVKRSPEGIVHHVDRVGLAVGDRVSGKIDWRRRYRLMRSHTSAHLLANVLWRELAALITGNQLDLDQCRMDFSAKEFDRNLLKSFEAKTNALVDANIPVAISFEKFEEAVKRPELFRLKDVLPKNIPVLRILSIGDVDVQADGGTHVARTKEVGHIQITDLKNKGAQNRRIYWELEE